MRCSPNISPQYKKWSPFARRICHIFSIFHLSVFTAADTPCTFRETWSASKQRQLKRTQSTSTAPTRPSYPLSSLLSNLRGGSGNRNGNISVNKQSNKSKLESTCIQNHQKPQQFVRKVWSSGYCNRNRAKERRKNKNFPEEESYTNICQDPLDNAAVDDDTETKLQKVERKLFHKKQSLYSPFRMYCSCMGIVSLWMLTGTLFYSYINEWPIPQSFFYAVDAGMSIGFCTDVTEIKLVSKAFTVVYILLGASVVGGALALFIQDIVEGVVKRERQNEISVLTKNFELKLGKEVFEKFDASHTGTLNKDEFTRILRSRPLIPFVKSATQQLSENDIDTLWTKFDRTKEGVIYFKEFAGTYRGVEKLISPLQAPKNLITNRTSYDDKDKNHAQKIILESMPSLVSSKLSSAKSLLQSENRIYAVFLIWVILGISWGMIDQKWDPITATHFAISALATGGLTAPPVNSNGILPAEPAIFCGCYCLFGIPLMAITFGHFARVLVSDHVAALEKWALTRPITATDYEIAKRYLFDRRGTNTDYNPTKTITKGREKLENLSSSSTSLTGLCLSDFIVLQLLRHGKISMETIHILRKEFELLDTDKTSLSTLEEATNCTV